LPRHAKREVFSVTRHPDQADGCGDLVAGGHIQLRATGGWRKIAAVLSRKTWWRPDDRDDRMNRRAFVCALAGATLLRPRAVHAQPAGKLPRIGYLSVERAVPGLFHSHDAVFDGAA
jgi:hypothetical protein